MDVGRRDLAGARPARRPALGASASSVSAATGARAGPRRAPRSARRRGRRSGAGGGRRSRRRRRRPRAAGWSRPSRRPRARRAAGAGASSALGQLLDDRDARAGRRAAGAAATQRRQATPLGGARRAAASAASAPAPARTRSPSSKSRASADDRPRPAALAPRSSQRGDQLRVAVEADHRVAAPGEVQGDPAGAAAEVEDRPVGRVGQLLPERQVGRVGAALDVVPDRARPSRSSPELLRQAAVGEQLAQLEQGGVGGQGEEPAGAPRRRRGRARRSISGSTSIASSRPAGVLEPQRHLRRPRAGADDPPHARRRAARSRRPRSRRRRGRRRSGR